MASPPLSYSERWMIFPEQVPPPFFFLPPGPVKQSVKFFKRRPLYEGNSRFPSPFTFLVLVLFFAETAPTCPSRSSNPSLSLTVFSSFPPPHHPIRVDTLVRRLCFFPPLSASPPTFFGTLFFDSTFFQPSDHLFHPFCVFPVQNLCTFPLSITKN